MNSASLLKKFLRKSLLLSVWGAGSAASGDIAGLNSSGSPWLAWTEGERAYLAFCDNSTTIRSHATCQRNIQIVVARDLYKTVVEHYRTDIERAEQLITESYVNIQLVDNRIQAMINDEVASGQTPQGASLLQQVEDLRIDLAELDVQRTELADQVARLELALMESPTGDLTSQLYAVRKLLREKEEEVNTIKDQIAAKYQQYSAINSQLLDVTIYEGLQQQRRSAVQNLHSGMEKSRVAVRKATNASLALKMLDDHSFAFIHENGAYQSTSEAALYIYNYGFP